MDNNKLQLIGSPCGQHGPYTFYKAFKYNKNGRNKILALSDFFFVKMWSDSDLMSIGELLLLWMDKNTDQMLASLRLYFLPENTPEGRNDDHGEDEVLAISEKVVLRVSDLLDWITEGAHWARGLSAICDKDCDVTDEEHRPEARMLLVDSVLDLKDIFREKQSLGESVDEPAVLVLSFPRYCRYRGLLKRLEGVANRWLRHSLVLALGGLSVPSRNTRILFCKDTFDYPDLEGHEALCNHLAPNLKGRPRRKRKKRSVSPQGSESNESESSLSTVSSSVKNRFQQNGLHFTPGSLVGARRSNRQIEPSAEEKEFLVKLHAFMRSRNTPISRIPNLGFKELNLYNFYKQVQKLGGYNSVTANRMWKQIYDEMGGHQGSTSAATYTRRHYERLLLPYERNVLNEQIKYRPQIKIKTEVKREPGSPPSETKVSGESSSSKIPAMRGIKPKVEKSEDCPNNSYGKENIPLTSEGSSTSTPEVIDLASDPDTPVKLARPPVPTLKKRKLDILKEGGLEVTAISSRSDAPSQSQVSVSVGRRPSVIQPTTASSNDNQVSITVTPDVGPLIDMMSSPQRDAGSTSSPSSGELSNPPRTLVNVSDLKRGNMQIYTKSGTSRTSSDSYLLPRVTQSRSIYAHSELTVYGNPKDGLETPKRTYIPRTPVKPTSVGEILDLRVKCGSYSPQVTVSCIPGKRNVQKGSNSTPFPIIDGRAMVGSNLEITVVDAPKPGTVVQPRQPTTHKQISQKKVPASKFISQTLPQRSENGRTSHYNNSVSSASSAQLIIPNPYLQTSSRDGARSRVPSSQSNASSFIPAGSSANFSSYLAGSGGKPPFVPGIEPLLYQSLYNSHSLFPHLQSPFFSQTAEQLQMYKDLMNQQFLQQSLLGLPRDGSTSIIPIGQAQIPTSK